MFFLFYAATTSADNAAANPWHKLVLYSATALIMVVPILLCTFHRRWHYGGLEIQLAHSTVTSVTSKRPLSPSQLQLPYPYVTLSDPRPFNSTSRDLFLLYSLYCDFFLFTSILSGMALSVVANSTLIKSASIWLAACLLLLQHGGSN